MVRRVGQVYDEMLVLLAAGGQARALERLASRWRPRHYAHARRLLGAPDQAADAVQDAWVSILRSIGRLRDPSRFPAWSYAIVTRRCRDIQRRAVRTKAGALEDDIEAAPVGDPDSTHDLRRGLEALPPDQRAAIALFYRDGFTVTEIAEALAVPAGTVKTRLFHARRALRRHFEGDET
ncbi:MAG: RNA polymerase sigma factor [Maricaulaceae bacterium]|jgi:RNA polymerase sigma-70 factor (ECF subfamily)